MDNAIKRVQMEDLFIVPMFVWTWNEKNQTTDREFKGWYAYTINERGIAYYPVPPGSQIWGSPSENELYDTPEAAFNAAQDYRKGKLDESQRAVERVSDSPSGSTEGTRGREDERRQPVPEKQVR